MPAGAVVVRMGWLDALRGVAALLVAVYHSTFHFVPGIRGEVLRWFNPGHCGVMLFFLVSGYVIPASLERRGDVRGFWIGRFFRIYPLWGAVCGAAVVLALVGLKPLHPGLALQNPVGAVLAHLSMLQEVLATQNMIGVLWTLSFEMSFYLLVVALFVLRWHEAAPGWLAAGFALASVAAGGVVSAAALSRGVGTDLLAFLVPVLLVLAIGGAVSGRTGPRVGGAVLGGLLGLVLAAANGSVGPWHGLIILAVMFTGTMVHRAERGRMGWIPAVLVAAVVLACGLGTAIWHAGSTVNVTSWCTGMTLAALLFGMGLALRHRRIPGWLAWLGLVSYSIYLVHPVLLVITDLTVGRFEDNPAMELAFLAALLAVCWVTHRFVEAPAQRLGRRIAAHLAARVSAESVV